MSEASEQSLQCLSVRRSAGRFREDAGLIGALVGAVIVLLIWGRGSGRSSGYTSYLIWSCGERPPGNTCALGGQTTVGRVLVDGPWEIAR